MLRNDLNQQINNGTVFKFIRSLHFQNPNPFDFKSDKLFLNNSNIG